MATNVDPPATVVDNQNGTYTITFSTERSGTYDLHIKLNGEELVFSPYVAAICKNLCFALFSVRLSIVFMFFFM